MSIKLPVIGVIGAGECGLELSELAQQAGSLIAKSGHILVCGGLTGVMEAAAKGAKEAGGMTIGILPGTSKIDANRFIDIAIPTGLGYAKSRHRPDWRRFCRSRGRVRHFIRDRLYSKIP